LVWSTWGIIVKHLQIDAVQMVFFTALFSLPAIIAIIVIKNHEFRKSIFLIRKNYLLLAFLAFSLLLNNFFYFAAFNRTSIAISVFTHYTAPLFVVMLTPFMLAENFDRRLVVPLLIATLGLASILMPDYQFLPNSADMAGAFCGIASGLAYAFTLIFAKRLTAKISPLTLILGQSFFIALFLLPVIYFTPMPVIPISNWYWLLILGITHCTMAPLLYITGLKYIKAQHAAAVGYLEPLAAVLLGLFLAHEAPSTSIWIGGAAILLSGAIITCHKTST